MSHFAVHCRMPRGCCLSEALCFATGMSLYDLGILSDGEKIAFQTQPYARLRDVNACLESVQPRSLPARSFTLRRWSKPDEIKHEVSSVLVLPHILLLNQGIWLLSCDVAAGKGTTESHTVVWDGWRRLFFVGAGKYHARRINGLELMEAKDDVNRFSRYVADSNRYGIETVHDVFQLFVARRTAWRTRLNTCPDQ